MEVATTIPVIEEAPDTAAEAPDAVEAIAFDPDDSTEDEIAETEEAVKIAAVGSEETPGVDTDSFSAMYGSSSAYNYSHTAVVLIAIGSAMLGTLAGFL